jgi:16S rRNA (uracil1498-N3)-methyltransferase
MFHRFFCPELNESGSVTLNDTEAHHLIHVLRSQPGNIVEVFNGLGLSATCRIASVRKRDAELEVIAVQRTEPPSPVLTLATAVPKGDRFDWLIEKATELGVTCLIPLVTTRSVVDPRDSKLDKLRQTVISACKQSGRNHLMKITGVTSWSDFVKQMVPAHQTFIAHPQGNSVECGNDRTRESAKPLLFAIGPEGGFTDDEVQSAITAGATLICLGSLILRIETAAIALAAKFLL